MILSGTIFAESPTDFFAKGLRYYLRGDYDSAREMFKNSVDAEGDVGAQSRFYMASISAYKGEKSAYDSFAALLKNPPKDKINAVAFELAKFASANGEYKKLYDDLKPVVESGKSDSLVDWYFAEALVNLKKEAEAKSFFEKSLQKYFTSPDAIGVDMFVESYIADDKFAKSFDISTLPNSTSTARARLEIMCGENVSQPLQEVSLFALIDVAESGAQFDKKLLSDSVFKYRYAPFAWRGSLALSVISFREKNYKLAETFARDAELLAPPEMEYQRYCFLALGDALRLQKNYSEAIYYYQKIYMAKRMGGEIAAESIYKTGLCYYEQGEWGNAHRCFERVFVLYFKFEYWGSRAYYYDARALYSLGLSRDAKATLVEYFKRTKDKKSEIYLQAKEFYDNF